MRNLRKITAITLVVAMILSLVSLNVFAADAKAKFELKASSSTIKAGESTEVELYISAPDGSKISTTYVGLLLTFDSKFSTEKVEIAGSVFNVDCYGNEVIITTDKVAEVSSGAPVAKIKVSAASDVTAGSYAVSMTEASAFSGDLAEDWTGKITLAPVTLVVPESVTVNSTYTAEAKTAEYGMPLSAVGLPTTATTKGTNGSGATVDAPINITWDENSYSATTLGEQNVTGTVTGGNDMVTITGNGAKATAKVTVNKAAATSVVLDPASISIDQNDTAMTKAEMEAVLANVKAVAKSAYAEAPATVAWTVEESYDVSAEGKTYTINGVASVASDANLTIGNAANVSIVATVESPISDPVANQVAKDMKNLASTYPIASVTSLTVDDAQELYKEVNKAYNKLNATQRDLIKANVDEAIVNMIAESDYSDALTAISAVSAVGKSVNYLKSAEGKVPTAADAMNNIYNVNAAKVVLDSMKAGDVSVLNSTDATAAKAEYADAVKFINDAMAVINAATTADVVNALTTQTSMVTNGLVNVLAGTSYEEVPVASAKDAIKDAINAVNADTSISEADKATMVSGLENAKVEIMVPVISVANIRQDQNYTVMVKRDSEVSTSAATVDITVNNVTSNAQVASGTITLAAGKTSGSISFKAEATSYNVGDEISVAGVYTVEGGTPLNLVTKSYTVAKKAGSDGGGGGYNPPVVKPSATPTPSDEPNPSDKPGTNDKFSDVNSSYWAYEFIESLSSKGIINGYGDGTFKPENNITRAEFTKMVVEVAGLATGSTSSNFVDVTANDWYAPYVVAAANAGIVNGEAADWFNANGNITREDICTILGRAFPSVFNGTADLTFSDASSISSYAVDYVKALVAAGVVNGYEDGTFRPQNNAARSEAAKMLDMTDDLVNGEPAPTAEPTASEEPTSSEEPTTTEEPSGTEEPAE